MSLKKFLILGVIFLLLVSLIYIFQNKDKLEKKSIAKESCLQNNGKWLEKYNECELGGLTQENRIKCQTMNGQFLDCTSPCRHNPNAQKEFCAQICVPVCKF